MPRPRSRGRVKRSAEKSGNPCELLKRQALTDGSVSRRKRAIEGLISACDEKAKSALVQALLNDRDEDVRLAALENLLWYDEDAPRQALVKAALRDRSPRVRQLAIEEGFAELAEDDRSARRVLIQALSDKDPANRLIVVEALAELDLMDESDKEIERALKRAIRDKDEQVRLATIDPLEEKGMKSVLAEAARSDSSSLVREAAAQAVANLSD